MIKNVKIVIIQAFKSKFYQYFVFTKKLTFLTFFGGGGVKMCDKMTISAYTLKIVEKVPFLRLQMRAKEMYNRHQFLSHK